MTLMRLRVATSVLTVAILLAGCDDRHSWPSSLSMAPLPPGSVAMQQVAGVYTVPVTVNGALTLDFMIDSGASHVSIPADVFRELVRAGTVDENDFVGTQNFMLADGSSVPSNTFRIRELRVGQFVLQDVLVSVSDGGPLLLGQSFLSRFESWSIDNSRHVLRLQPASADQVANRRAPPPASPAQPTDLSTSDKTSADKSDTTSPDEPDEIF
jgi:clan AA aspartic protease (TIGR02281 family)